MRHRYLIAGIIALTSGLACASVEAEIAGTWLTQAKDAVVRVEDCGDGSPCGVIQWVKPNPKGPLDANNPDPQLKTRPLVGLRLLYGFKQRDGVWEQGRIYDPSSGRTYAAHIATAADGTLKVSGCVGPFCQNQIWTRVK